MAAIYYNHKYQTLIVQNILFPDQKQSRNVIYVSFVHKLLPYGNCHCEIKMASKMAAKIK